MVLWFKLELNIMKKNYLTTTFISRTMKRSILALIWLCCSFCMYGQLPKGYIIKIDGERIYLDLHAPDVKVSDKVSVYATGGLITHPVTKKQIRTEGETIGTIEITQVYESYSIGKMLPDATVALKEGMEVGKEPVLMKLPVTQPAATQPVATPPAVSAQDGKAAVIVAPAEVNDVVGVGHFGGYVSDILMEQLLMGDKVRLLDRSALNAQLDEMQLTGEYIDPNTAIRRGRIAGARYIIQVTMQKPDVVNIRTGVPLAAVMGAAQAMSGANIGAQYASNMQVGTLKAAVNISTRVVDLETGEVVFMCSGSGKSQGKSQLALEYGALGGTELNGGADGFKQTVTGKAIQQAFTSIGRNLNSYFAGNVDKKVIGSAGGGTRYGDALYRRGNGLFLGVEKLNMESAQMAFVDNPEWYFQYRSARKNIKTAKFCYVMAGVTLVLPLIPPIINLEWDNDIQNYVIVGTVAAGGLTCLGITLNKKGHSKLDNTVGEYNRSQSQASRSANASLNLVYTGNGIGLRLNF
jgi:curli biogenesis system outer membrane secretion channel CsgG